MASKALLPVLGGSASVWSVSLAFFQTALLAGYAYAHLLGTRLSPRRAAAVHVALLAAAVVWLPWRGLAVGAGPGGTPPAAWVVGQLASSVGLPFFVLAASGPLLQRWLASAADPYRLYALGNAGSLAALVGYPLVVERHLPLAPPAGGLTQTGLWSAAFVLFAALSAACAALAARSPRAAIPAERPAPRLSWIALAAVPSGALVATTQALTLDVAYVPLLWVLPLAAYLATFIVTFGRARPPVRGAAIALALLALAAAACRWAAPQPDPHVAIPLDLGALVAIGLVCHGRLARQRPGPAGLTGFYLCIAAGGALGSLFCALVAPRLFSTIAEHPIMLVLGCLTLPAAPGRLGRAWPLAVAAVVATVLLAAGWRGRPGHVLLAARSFYGALRVVEAPGPTFMPSVGPHAGQAMSLPTHVLYSGTTLHGIQVTRPSEARLPTSYYHPSGPIGRVFLSLRAPPAPLGEVALVGLGVGSLAAYAEPGDRFTFFEIDPQVVRVARDPALFTYLRDARGTVQVVVADGRVALTGVSDGSLRLLVIDAFGSDAVPAHLLTREALALDLRKLRPGGVVAFHLSSSFFDLAPVVAEAAASLGKPGLFWHDTHLAAVEVITGKRPSDWAVVGVDGAALQPLLAAGAPWVPLASQRRTSGGPWLWTDRFSSPLAALRPWGGGIGAPRVPAAH